jgi:hypothetical protein
MAKGDKKGKSKITVDFGGVDKEIRKHTERASLVPDGDYLVKLVSGTVKESERSGSKFINWRAQIVKPAKYKGKAQYGMTSLKPDALWNLRNLIHAATGKNVAGKAVNFDFESVYGKVVGAVVEQEEYNGKMRSRINTWFPKEEYEDKDEEEDEDEEYEEEEDEDEDLEDVEVEDL